MNKWKPLFSVVCISLNEAHTIHKMMWSLREFQDRWGEIIILDTWSTDGTAELARSLWARVTEVWEKFIQIIDEETAKRINDRFVVEWEADLVKPGNRLFNFAAARNYATSLASNDFIMTMDIDEVYTNLDIDKVNGLIEEWYEQFEYQFIFAHDVNWNPSIQFIQSKAFDRRKISWSWVVHEVLGSNQEVKRLLLDESIILLEHYQEQGKDHRGNYLVGLALDCLEHPDSDRNSHYLWREAFYTWRPKSAIKELTRHVNMHKWTAEAAQSMIFIGMCYGQLWEEDKQIEWYHKAFDLDPNRREPLIRLAEFYNKKNNPKATAAFASAALQIPLSDYYANDMNHYKEYPHQLLYNALGWIWDIDWAKGHLLKALEYNPYNNRDLENTKYYFEYPDNWIPGWMTFPELQWLYNNAKKYDKILEIWSWKGRSSHALLSGCKWQVTCVDTFQGSDDINDATNSIAKQENIYDQFMANVGHFKNLKVLKMSSAEAAEQLKDEKFDLIFLDALHTKKWIIDDINLWKDKATKVICGHDYSVKNWPNLVEWVNETIWVPDNVTDSIWQKNINSNNTLFPFVSILIPTLWRPEGLKRCLDSIEHLDYPKDRIEVLVEEDEPRTGVARRLNWLFKRSKGDYCVFMSNDTEMLTTGIVVAVRECLEGNYDLVSFNTWELLPDKWNINAHFMIKKSFVYKYLDWKIFDEDFNHIWVDNLLWAQVNKWWKAKWLENVKLNHYHFSNSGAKIDSTYELGWSHVEEDRKLLEKKIKELEVK